MVRFDFRTMRASAATAATTTGARRRRESNHTQQHRRQATEMPRRSPNETRNNGLPRKAVGHLAAAPSLLIGLLLFLSSRLLDGAKCVAEFVADHLPYSHLVSGGKRVLCAIVRIFHCLYDSGNSPSTGQMSLDTPAPPGILELRVNHQISDNHRRDPSSHKVWLGSGQTRYLGHVGDRSSELAHYNVSFGCCLYSDGSPAPVPPGNCAGRVPRHYHDHHGSAAAAAAATQAWQATQEWRIRKGVWKIHARPLLSSRHSYRYPLYLHGRTQSGAYVLYEPTAQINLRTMSGDDTAAKTDYLLRQFVAQLEYMGNVLAQSDNGCATPDTSTTNDGPGPSSSSWGFVYVMDVKGVGWSELAAIAHLKVRALELLAQHYPNNCTLIVVANVPSWLKAVAPPTLPSVERAGAQFAVWTEAETVGNLSALVGGLDDVPRELGGTSPYGLGQHPVDVAFHQLLLYGAPVGDATLPKASSMALGPRALPCEQKELSSSDAGTFFWRRNWANLLLPKFRKTRTPEASRLYVVRSSRH